jgi:uncharacterized phage protein (TIGR01671 family)
MREIEFRGKSKKSKQWVYGVPIKVGLSNCVVMCSSGNSLVNNLLTNPPQSIEWVEIRKNEVIPETVGQYTGLKDKNGIEIYEGDIIDIHQTVNGCNLFEIVWDKTRWNARYGVPMVKPRLYEYNFNNLLDVDAFEKEIEVVGNIHDNPELIG